MKFGIFSVVDHYPRELDRSAGRLYAELLEQVQAADDLGFESFWIAEHHFHEYGNIPRPAVWLASAAARTRRIRLGAAVVVLPLDNPLRTAEDFAMVDMLSEGRLNLGLGSGYLKHEFDGFGIPMSEKRARFDESLEIIVKAWSGERFTHHGRHYRFDDVQLNVQPVQQPHPAAWIAILSNATAEHVGRRGFPIMMIPYATAESFDELTQTVTAHRRGFLAAGGRQDAISVPFGLHSYCHEDGDRARFEARPAMDRYVRTRLYAKQRSFETLLDKKLAAFGSPEEIIDVARAYEAAGLTHFLTIMNFGGLEHSKVLKSMETMAKHVLPAFRTAEQSVQNEMGMPMRSV